MTNYEKFLKGKLSKPAGFIFRRFKEDTLTMQFYSYRVSNYKGMYYFLGYLYLPAKRLDKANHSNWKIYQDIIKANGIYIRLPGDLKEDIVLLDYDITFNNFSYFVPTAILLLKFKTLEGLNSVLKNKKRCIVCAKTWKRL